MKAQELAKYIITKCTLDNSPISNLQLQKILYFIHGAFYNRFKHGAFDDIIEAWEYGPVIPNVYREYKKYVSSPICDINLEFTDPFSLSSENDEINVINIVTERLRKLPPSKLVNISHEKDSPWSKTFNGFWSVISDELIKEYFEKNNEIFEKLGIDFNSEPKIGNPNDNEAVLNFLKELDKLLRE